MQNLFFIIPLIVIALLIFAVALFINKRKKLAAGYNLSNPDLETILVSPSRLTMLSLTMMGMGGFFLFVTLMSISDVFDFQGIITYIILGLMIIILSVFIIGLRLFLKRNHVVQLQFDADALKYLSVDWRPKKGRTLFLLVFNQKFTFLPYSDMRKVEIAESSYFGDSMVIRTIADTLYLPFFRDNEQRMNAVVEKLKSHIIEKERY